MRKLKQLLSANPMVWAVIGIEAFYWIAGTSGMYQTVYLKGLGLDATVIGYITALCSAVAIFATPVWGVLCDKFQSTRRVTALCIALGCVLWALVPLTSLWMLGPVSFLLIILPLGNFFRTPGATLMEAVVIENCVTNGIVYSRIRIAGSISYALFSFVLVRWLPTVGYQTIFYYYGILMIPAILLIAFTGSERRGASVARPLSLKEMQLGTLLKDRSFLFFLIFSFACTLPINTSFTYIPYLLEELGIDEALLGLTVGIRALTEAPALLLTPFLCKKLSVRGTLILSAFILAGEHLLYAVTGNLATVLALSVLHGLGVGVRIALVMYYVRALAPVQLQATAQAVNATAGNLATIFGNVIAGHLILSLGIRGFYVLMGSILVLGTLFWVVSLRFTRKIDVTY